MSVHDQGLVALIRMIPYLVLGKCDDLCFVCPDHQPEYEYVIIPLIYLGKISYGLKGMSI